MRIELFAFTARGTETAGRIMDALPEEELRAYTVDRFLTEGFRGLGSRDPDFYGKSFSRADAMIFVGACGIAVRSIAPWVRDKRTDPAVISVDEGGRFVIPLLSGHIGGANALARRLAAALDAVAVVTTATDVNGRFSVDEWAARNGCAIGDMAAAKAVSAAILEGDVPLRSDFSLEGDLPPGIVPAGSGELGVYITCGTKEPFRRTLRLIPPVLHLGLGCRRGTPDTAIQEAVETVFRDNGLDLRAVKEAASIDLKADEPGLLAFCEAMGRPVRFYSAETLRGAAGTFSGSDFVRETTGVDNVCERAAVMGGGKLIVRKTALGGVTVAVAMEDWEVRFG